jgi:hypothetical protein
LGKLAQLQRLGSGNEPTAALDENRITGDRAQLRNGAAHRGLADRNGIGSTRDVRLIHQRHQTLEQIEVQFPVVVSLLVHILAASIVSAEGYERLASRT